MELEALDAPGLLAKVSQMFVNQNINLHMAKISTIGERAEDLFIISNSEDKALSTDEQIDLKKQLTTLLDQPEESGEVMSELKNVIEEAFEQRASITAATVSPAIKQAVLDAIAMLNSGEAQSRRENRR